MITVKTVSLESEPILFAATILRRFVGNECLFVEALNAGQGSLQNAYDWLAVQNLDDSFASIFGHISESTKLDYAARIADTQRYIADLSVAIGGDVAVDD